MVDENNHWHTLLRQQGARIQDGYVADFGNAEEELRSAESGTVIVPLIHLGLMRASGSDTAAFLQGQTSNDVRHVDPGHHQLNSYNTPKGRMLALFLLFQRDEDYYLQLPLELEEALQKRLGMFILRSDVKLLSVDGEMASLAIAGPDAVALITKQVGGCPEEAGDSLTLDGVTVLRRPGEQPRFICVAPSERLTALWQSLQPEAIPVGVAAWELLEIRAGIPAITTATVEAFVPQMLNLQLVDGVNFKKGCYPGQEVVARMQYLGKLKRRMYRAAVDAGAVPVSGTDLYSPESASGQGAGKVVRAAPKPDGGSELLVVSEISNAEGDSLFLGNEDGPKLQMLELPYAFE